MSDILRPSLIVSGTHGASGMQKIFGSHVEKINNNSATPLPLTRGDKHMDKVDTIVMPFSFAKESLQITSFAGSMAKISELVFTLLRSMTAMILMKALFRLIRR